MSSTFETIGLEFKTNLEKFLRELSRAESAVDKTAASTGKVNRANDQMASSASRAADGQRKLASSMGGTEKAVGALAARLGFLIGSFMSLQKIMGAAEQWTTLTNRLKLVTSSTQELAAAQQTIVRIAKATGSDLGSTAELYQRIANNQKALGLSTAQLGSVTETVSKAIAISGVSAGAAQAALTQFSQALASGTLRGDELNSIMEQTPSLAQAIAEGMGLTVGQLRAYGAEGKLSAQAVINALQKQANAVDSAFAKTDMTVGQAMTNMNTSFVQLVGQMDQATGASALLAQGINWLAENLGTLATLVATGAIAVGLVALVANFAAVTAAIGAATAASIIFMASLGPIGWAVIAVTGLTAAYMALQEQIEGTGDYAMSLGDTFMAVGEMAWEAMGLAEEGAIKASDANAAAAENTMGWWETALVNIAGYLDGLATAFYGTAAGINQAFKAAASAMMNAFAQAFNWIIEKAETTVNAIGSGINAVLGAFGMEGVGKASFGRVSTSGASFGDIGAAFDKGKASVRITSGADFVNQIRGRVGMRVAARKASAGSGGGGGAPAASKGGGGGKKGGGKKGGRGASGGGKSEADRVAEEMKKRAQAYEEARIAAELYIQTEAERYRRELQGVGMGKQWRDRNAAENQINDKYQKDRERLQSELRTDKLTQEEYSKHLAIVESTHAQALALERNFWAEKLKLQANWEVGASEALQNYADQVANVAQSTEQMFTNAFKGMEDALVQFVKTGKLDFKSLADSIISDMIRIAIQQSITGPLANWAGGLFSGMAGGDIFFGNALGGVYNSPGLSAYSGQIVSKPTLFPFAKGTGLMGEAGPEAILPLKRGPGGYLGVRADGGGGDTTVNIVINTDGSSRSNSSGPKEEQMGQLGKMVEGAVMSILHREQRPGGVLA